MWRLYMYEIDELAGIVALAGEKEQLALVEDIKANGQQEPAVLWQNKLVDGRCRQLACYTLGIELKVRHLDSNLSRGDVAKIVKSLNTRRNLTMTQKIVSAYKQQLRTKEVNESVATQWAISVPSLKNMKYIARHMPSAVDVLFNGGTVQVNDPDLGYDITTNKISTLARIIKKKQEVASLVVSKEEEIAFTVDGVIKTEAGKAWFYERKGTYNLEETKDIQLLYDLIELANYKFKLKEQQ